MGLICVPVKYNWRNKANLELIRHGAKQLQHYVYNHAKVLGWKLVFVPRLGCGNGQLSWKEVEPILEEELTAPEFMIVHHPMNVEDDIMHSSPENKL